MKYFLIAFCLLAINPGALAAGQLSSAETRGRFQAKSKIHGADLIAKPVECPELGIANRYPDVENKTRQVASNPEVPRADLFAKNPEEFPIVRFELKSGKYRGRHSKVFRHKRTNDLIVGEVSVDTGNGDVALDGRLLRRGHDNTRCE